MTPVLAAAEGQTHVLLFAQVVDHFGDAAIAWRLASALAALPESRGARFHLLIDDLEALESLVPNSQLLAATSDTISGTKVHGGTIATYQWQPASPLPTAKLIARMGLQPRDHLAVITLLDAAPAEQDLADLIQQCATYRWVHYHYLATNSWAPAFHDQWAWLSIASSAMNTLEPTSAAPVVLARRNYFPGIWAGSGSLLSAPIVSADQTQAEIESMPDWAAAFARLGVSVVSLYAYAHAPFQALYRTLHEIAIADNKALLIVAVGAQSCPLPAGVEALVNSLETLPFENRPISAEPQVVASLPAGLYRYCCWQLPLAHYDALLPACEVNLVRGEDSLSRALSCGQPFLWQAYAQIDQAHLEKIEGLLEWWQNQGITVSAQRLQRAWNADVYAEQWPSSDEWRTLFELTPREQFAALSQSLQQQVPCAQIVSQWCSGPSNERMMTGGI